MAERATLIQSSFNGGEISPRLHGRIDQAVYAISTETMLGWLPLIQGPATAAPGTRFVEAAAGPCRLFEFEYNVTQGYVVEASAGKFRFYTNDVRLESGPGVPIEVAHPYSHDDLMDLDHQQSADVLYLAGAGKQSRKLSRTAADAFSLSLLELRNGPIGPANSDEGITVQAGGTTGTVTLTASEPIFAATDVGSFFEIEARDYSDIVAWEPGMDASGSIKVTSFGSVYQRTGGETRTGSVPPSHDEGAEFDGQQGKDINDKGPYGVKWTFLYGRHGLLKITGFTSATQVTATVIKRLADSLVTTPSWRWAFGAFSDTRGWPETVCLWDESLVLTKGNTAYVSVVGDLENFQRRDSAGDFQRDLAGSFTLPDPAKINWTAVDRELLLSTEKREYAVERLLVQSDTAGPPMFKVRRQTRNGSARKKPVDADGGVLFLQRAGRKLLEFGYSIGSDRYQSPDMTVLADHIGQYGFRELAFQAEPERLLWAVLDNGDMAAMTYLPDQQVKGWCRRTMGGGMKARSLCRITDPEGKRDQIWIAAETAGGAHWILRMEKIWEVGDDQQGAFFVDAGLSYDGAPTAAISGLDHLEGETVQILADGKPHTPQVVTGGAISLEYQASKVHAGFGFPAILKLLRLEGGQHEGTAQGKLKRVIEVKLRLLETLGLYVTVQDSPEQIPIETRLPADAMDEAVPLFSGDISLSTIGTYERGGQVTIERYQPTPATLLAVMPVVEVGET